MDKDCIESGDAFTFSCAEYDDDGPYFDMNFHGTTISLEDGIENRDSEEFEFTTSSISSGHNRHLHHVSEPTDDVSPADDLFYRGQLLPLYLPPRLQMVRNLSMSKESEDNYMSPDGSMGFPSRHEGFNFDFDFDSSFPFFEDSKQEPGSCKQVEFSSAKTEKTQHFSSVLKSATKFKVSLFGFRKSSKVGMDDHHSTRYFPPLVKHPKFTIKLNSMKTPGRIFAKNYSTRRGKSPDYSSRNTSVKRVLQKYLRMMKLKFSQRHNASADDQQLQAEDECERPCIAGESGRKDHISFSGNLKMGFRHLGIQSCSSSMKSSSPQYHKGVLTSFHGDDLQNGIQAAIAHCKQSNGISAMLGPLPV